MKNLIEFKKGSIGDIISKQMDFLYEQGKKIAEEMEENRIQDEDSFDNHDCKMTSEDGCDHSGHQTLCHKPHNNGDNDTKNCTECLVIKFGI